MTRIYGADIPLHAGLRSIETLIEAVALLRNHGDDCRLHLAAWRNPETAFPVLHLIEEHGLEDAVTYHPYTDVCRDFPIRKWQADRWFDATNTPAEIGLLARNPALRGRTKRRVLFVTYMHPWKFEGNSALMRDWLSAFRAASYAIDLLYYAGDPPGAVTPEMRAAAAQVCDTVRAVPVRSPLVGFNRDGMNVHVDDWCGPELLDAATDMVRSRSYDMAFVNYAFLSAVFDGVQAYTEKVLLTHDRFENRNRRMLAQGFPDAGWLSLDRAGEALACRRADTVVALQDEETAYFREISDDPAKVVTVAPVQPPRDMPPPPPAARLRIGYFGSHNWVNERNLGAFLESWIAFPEIADKAEIVVAGSLCDHLQDFIPSPVLAAAAPRLLGRVAEPADFLAQCDLVINPERGGTGLKIKTLETMAQGMAFAGTAAATVGFRSDSRFHTAPDIPALAELVREIVENPSLLEIVRNETRRIYRAHWNRYRTAMADLIGTPPPEPAPIAPRGTDGPAAPTVSVVVPFYGVERDIDACLHSVRGQDYPALEIVLVDDASPDGSRTIAERHAAEDSRIRIVTNEANIGLGPSRNAGVAAATGDWLFFLDSDDLLAAPDTFRQLVNTARMQGCQVVACRAERLVNDTRIEPFDTIFECRADSDADALYQAGDAFRATFGRPGTGYLPMRAWGYMIDMGFYRAQGLNFPAGAHEDIGHTPVLCALADTVYYCPLVGVQYRLRTDSISQDGWSAARARGFLGVWHHFRDMLDRHGLQDLTGYAAMMTVRQALWKIEGRKPDADDLGPVMDVMTEILHDVRAGADPQTLRDGLDHVSDVVARFKLDGATARRALAAAGPAATITRHRATLGLEGTFELEKPIAAPMPCAECEPVATLPPPDPEKWQANDRRAEAILAQYDAVATAETRGYPCMLTEADKAVYYDAGLNYTGEGAIVDGGCFVGGTTRHLLLGLEHNPRFEQEDPRLDRAIKVYDLFEIDDDYILHHRQANFPERDFEIGGSFEPVFRHLMAPHAGLLDVKPGDVTKSGYPFDTPIEVLGVDLCKTLPVTDYVLRTFFPRLMPKALVIQRDFIHEFHPHIHLSMMRLDDHFDLDAEMRWGGSVSYRLRKPITDAVIRERFGTDTSWFEERDRNTALLTQLVERTHYHENRWVMLLTLGFYHYATGDRQGAREAYMKACDLYPQFTPSDLTRSHLAP